MSLSLVTTPREAFTASRGEGNLQSDIRIKERLDSSLRVEFNAFNRINAMA